MKIAITSTGSTLDDHVEPRFGRCAFFIIIETDTMQFEAVENPNIALGGGAGIQSAQLMSKQGVKTVLTGNCGPNAFHVFGQAGIQVVVGVSGPIRNAVEQFKAGTLSTASKPNVASHFGMGGRGGAGMGGGGGRGMGRGMAGSIGMPSSPPTAPTAEFDNDAVQELTELKQQAQTLEQQKQQLDQRISQLEQNPKAIAVVDFEKCTGCGLCAELCPVEAIKISWQRQAIVNESLCTGCAACVSRCPNDAISITV